MLGRTWHISGDALWLRRESKTKLAVLLTMVPELTTETKPCGSFLNRTASRTNDLLPCEAYQRFVSDARRHAASGALQAERLNARGARLFVGGVAFFPSSMGFRNLFASLAYVGPRWRPPLSQFLIGNLKCTVV